MERIVTALPDFDGNIDLSTLDSSAADFGSKSALATLDSVDEVYPLASIFVSFGFLSNFQLVQIWILHLDFQFELYQLGFEF